MSVIDFVSLYHDFFAIIFGMTLIWMQICVLNHVVLGFAVKFDGTLDIPLYYFVTEGLKFREIYRRQKHARKYKHRDNVGVVSLLINQWKCYGSFACLDFLYYFRDSYPKVLLIFCKLAWILFILP